MTGFTLRSIRLTLRFLNLLDRSIKETGEIEDHKAGRPEDHQERCHNNYSANNEKEIYAHGSVFQNQ